MRCDIVIPIWNQPEFTRDCICSIVRNTKNEYGLILIDNGSAHKVKQYLEELKATCKVPLTVITNEVNVGFVKAVNQGIDRSRAPYVCILNNDTLVQDGWLSEMIAVAESDDRIGIVNPSSNNLGQRPSSGESIESYAVRLKAKRGMSIGLGSALGFCMLIKRALIGKIGMFDEAYGMGNFEDTDFSRRTAKEGFRYVRACGAYVYHRESSSFRHIKTFETDFARNRDIYESRWGAPKRVLYVLNSCNAEAKKRIGEESERLAADGNWVSIYARGSADTSGFPIHSNITVRKFSDRMFLLKVWLKILTKKKRFHKVHRCE
jgi:GT2 family glycosyltransferase